MNNFISICSYLVIFLSISFGCGSEEVTNEEGEYKNGEKHGKWTSYCEHGKIIEEVNYTQGKKHGKSTSYFEDGQIWNEGNYKDGQEHGGFIYYGYGNYNLLHKIELQNYINGKLNGKLIHYHINGEISRIDNYKNDKENGTSIFYDKDGEIYWSGNYEHGNLINGSSVKSDKLFNLY